MSCFFPLDGSEEKLQFQQGHKHGEAEDHFKVRIQRDHSEFNIFCKKKLSTSFLQDGSREVRIYVNGTLNGPAEFFGANGDRLEFSYQDGKKFGGMTYFFTDGCIERSFFDEQGLQSGPTQFTWPSGAKREGHKVGLELVMRFACFQIVYSTIIHTHLSFPNKGQRKMGRTSILPIC